MFTTRTGAASAAKALRRACVDAGFDMPLSHCQELVARQTGYVDWHDATSRLAKGEPIRSDLSRRDGVAAIVAAQVKHRPTGKAPEVNGIIAGKPVVLPLSCGILTETTGPNGQTIVASSLAARTASNLLGYAVRIMVGGMPGPGDKADDIGGAGVALAKVGRRVQTRLGLFDAGFDLPAAGRPTGLRAAIDAVIDDLERGSEDAAMIEAARRFSLAPCSRRRGFGASSTPTADPFPDLLIHGSDGAGRKTWAGGQIAMLKRDHPELQVVVLKIGEDRPDTDMVSGLGHDRCPWRTVLTDPLSIGTGDDLRWPTAGDVIIRCPRPKTKDDLVDVADWIAAVRAEMFITIARRPDAPETTRSALPIAATDRDRMRFLFVIDADDGLSWIDHEFLRALLSAGHPMDNDNRRHLKRPLWIVSRDRLDRLSGNQRRVEVLTPDAGVRLDGADVVDSSPRRMLETMPGAEGLVDVDGGSAVAPTGKLTGSGDTPSDPDESSTSTVVIDKARRLLGDSLAAAIGHMSGAERGAGIAIRNVLLGMIAGDPVRMVAGETPVGLRTAIRIAARRAEDDGGSPESIRQIRMFFDAHANVSPPAMDGHDGCIDGGRVLRDMAFVGGGGSTAALSRFARMRRDSPTLRMVLLTERFIAIDNVPAAFDAPSSMAAAIDAIRDPDHGDIVVQRPADDPIAAIEWIAAILAGLGDRVASSLGGGMDAAWQPLESARQRAGTIFVIDDADILDRIDPMIVRTMMSETVFAAQRRAAACHIWTASREYSDRGLVDPLRVDVDADGTEITTARRSLWSRRGVGHFVGSLLPGAEGRRARM